MLHIKYENEKIISVFVPYHFSSDFRNVFKTAKWNAEEKVYEIKNNTKNKNALDKLIQALKNIDLTEYEMDEENLEKLLKRLKNDEIIYTQKLNKLKQSIEKNEKKIKEQQEVLNNLHSQKNNIEELEKINNELEQKTNQQYSDMKNFVDKIINIEKYNELMNIVDKFRFKKSFILASDKKIFYEAQNEIEEMQKELGKFGIYSKKLQEIIDVNLNRTDKSTNYYNLYEIDNL
ncbi:MAG: hypothetical protein [Caudoviricetes sp.]|nr:MAG: hypothetical protein [Caudoviricetes sp.]